MPLINRVVQFSPFAALTGYEDSIEENGRFTIERKETLSNDMILVYSREYVTRTGTVEKVDSNKRTVVLNGEEINIADVTDITNKKFLL